MKLVAKKAGRYLVSVDHQRAAACALFGYGLYTRDVRQPGPETEVHFSHAGAVGTLADVLAWLKGEEVPGRLLVYVTDDDGRLVAGALTLDR